MDRTRGIGGSDIAALMGISPWKTAYDVYLDKIGEKTPESKPHLEVGRQAQGAVLRKYEAYADTVIEEEDVEKVHPSYPFLIGNIDGIAHNGKTFIEAKTTAQGMKDWDWQIPPYYRTQVAFYAAIGNPDVVDMPVAYWFCYRCPSGRYGNPQPQVDYFTSLTYWRDEGFEQSVVDCAVEFWEEVVLKRKPPELKSFSDIKKRYGQSIESALEAPPDVKETIQKLYDRMEDQKTLGQEIDDLKIQVQKAAGDHALITNEAGQPLISFKTQERTAFDSARFKKEHPELFLKYSNITTTRPFKLLRRD